MLVEVVRAEPHREGQAFGPDGADGVQCLAMEAEAVVEAAAVFVGALVGERGEEAGAEVAVGEVHLQPLEPGRQRALGGVGVCLVQFVDLLDREGVDRKGVAPAIGNGRGGADLPAVGVIGRQLGFAFPRLFLAAFAAGVAELDGGNGTHVLDDGGDAGEALDLAVVPDAGAAGAGAAVRGDGDLLGEYQSEAAGGARAHEHDVEVGHASLHRAVHRHGGHGDAVAKRDALEGEGAEQVGHCRARGLGLLAEDTKPAREGNGFQPAGDVSVAGGHWRSAALPASLRR